MGQPDFTLEELLYHVDKRVYSKWWKHEEIEEYIQEARIHAWQDYQDGYTDRQEIVKRAANRVRNFLTSSTRAAPTGKPVKDHQERATEAGKKMRTKIKMYIKDYTELHDEKPTQTQIAKGIGTSIATVSRQMKRLHIDNRVSIPAHQVQVDNIHPYVEMGYYNPEGTDGEYGRFENETLTRIVISDYLDRCPERERTALYARFWEDKTNRGVAEALGGGSDQVGLNWVNKGLDSLRLLLAADGREYI